MKRATAADVARAAGVSRTTVSYVLNKTPHQQIPDATQRRVLEAAERLFFLMTRRPPRSTLCPCATLF